MLLYIAYISLRGGMVAVQDFVRVVRPSQHCEQHEARLKDGRVGKIEVCFDR